MWNFEIEVLISSFSVWHIMSNYGENKKIVIDIKMFPESYFLMYIFFFVYFYNCFLQHIYKMNNLQNIRNKLYTTILLCRNTYEIYIQYIIGA